VGHTAWLSSVAFSPDGKKIVSGSNDKTLRVWDADSGSGILGPLVGHKNSVTSVAFSPDGKKIVSGSCDTNLCVWDAESGSSILGQVVGHKLLVSSIALSPDGKKILSVSRDQMLRVWDAESGLPIAPHSVPDNNPSSELPSTGHSSFSHATISHDGWFMDSCGQMMFWIPAHLRGEAFGTEAIHTNDWLIWFNRNRLPIIVTQAQFGLSWWSQAGTS
jgi:WD40 repeat protein